MTTRQEQHDYAAEIASHMEGWEYDAEGSRGYDGELMPGVRLAGPGGRALLVSFDYRKKRLTVRGSWPKDGGRYRSARDYRAIEYGQNEPSISASTTRPAQAVARDIGRRLLPDFEKVWQKVQEYISYEKKYRDTVASRKAALAEGLAHVKENQRAADPDKGDFDLGSISKLGWYGNMQVTGGEDGCVTIKLHSLTAERARAVLEALK